MDGPTHYRTAEQLIGIANRSGPDDDPSIGSLLAEAQVHATLALAAATIDSAFEAAEIEPWAEAMR